MKNRLLSYLLLVAALALFFYAGIEAHSALGKANSTDDPVYLCGTKEMAGVKVQFGVGLLDEIELITAGPTRYVLRRQSTPCAGVR